MIYTRLIFNDMGKNENGRTVEGIGIVFGVESEDLGNFREVIHPEALGKKGEILQESDIYFLLNHNREKGMIARSNKGRGSLSLKLLPEGVQYSFTAPNSPIGQELVANLERGELDTSSFAFTVAAGGEVWERRKDDYLRTVTKISQVYDISSVYSAAYRQTSCTLREGVSARSTDEWEEGHKRARISGEPSPDEHKMMNVITLLDLREGDKVSGDEIALMVRLLEERGVKVPGRRFAALTHKEQHEFRQSYIQKAIDLKPQIQRAHRYTPEEQQLLDEFERIKKGEWR